MQNISNIYQQNFEIKHLTRLSAANQRLDSVFQNNPGPALVGKKSAVSAQRGKYDANEVVAWQMHAVHAILAPRERGWRLCFHLRQGYVSVFRSSVFRLRYTRATCEVAWPIPQSATHLVGIRMIVECGSNHILVWGGGV